MVSIGLVYVSRSSLHIPITHGFPRFLAWEIIVILFLLNVESWFRAPLSILQVISWLFLCISIILIVYGVWTLRVNGKPEATRDEEALLGIEKTTILVTTGIYYYIRHPFYSSLLFLAWGISLKGLSWSSILLAFVASICLLFTAIIEEREDIRFFGPAYQAYMKRSKRFIPLLF
jgi:protein-S-isoprenylcysteine O-methyltransferase Ste14